MPVTADSVRLKSYHRKILQCNVLPCGCIVTFGIVSPANQGGKRRMYQHAYRKPHRLLLLLAIACLAVLVPACGSTDGSSPTPPRGHHYQLIWTPALPGFPNVALTLEPIIPPQSIDLLPSNFVRATLQVGNQFRFSTDDPAYRCVEGVSGAVLPLLFAPEEEAITGFQVIHTFLFAYQSCGSLIAERRVPADMFTSLSALHSGSNEVLMFRITGQRLVSTKSDGETYTPIKDVTPLTPTVSPTVTPVTPTVSPTVTPVVSFSVQPTTTNGLCQSTSTMLAPFTLLLDNTKSNVAVDWHIDFKGLDSTNHIWAAANPPEGSVLAGSTSQVTITYSDTICKTNSNNTYSLFVSYTYQGASQSPPPITITAVVSVTG